LRVSDFDLRIQAALDRSPEIAQLVREVDRSLLHWSLSLRPMERLRALSQNTAGLARFKRAASENR
jgi:hypothetical protein